ncbi:hypothetical protein [Mucilaginibacter koreensis]
MDFNSSSSFFYGCCVGAACSGRSRCSTRSTAQQAQHPEAVRSRRSTTQHPQQ